MLLPDVPVVDAIGAISGVGTDAITGALVSPIPFVGISVLTTSEGTSLSIVDGCSVSASDGVRVVLGDNVIDGTIVGVTVTLEPPVDDVGAFVVLAATATGAGTATGTITVGTPAATGTVAAGTLTGTGTGADGTMGTTGANVALLRSGVTVGKSGISSKDVNSNES